MLCSIFNSIFLCNGKNLHPNLYAFIKTILFVPLIPFFVAIPLQKKNECCTYLHVNFVPKHSQKAFGCEKILFLSAIYSDTSFRMLNRQFFIIKDDTWFQNVSNWTANAWLYLFLSVSLSLSLPLSRCFLVSNCWCGVTSGVYAIARILMRKKRKRKQYWYRDVYTRVCFQLNSAAVRYATTKWNIMLIQPLNSGSFVSKKLIEFIELSFSSNFFFWHIHR